MAEKLIARSTKGKAPDLGHVATVELPNGTTVTKGDFVKVAGEAGAFRFHHGNRWNEVTVWGPFHKGASDKSGGPWGHAQWRTFRCGQVKSVSAVDDVKEAVAAVLTANGEVDYENMTAGQKAAYTKRMRAMTAAAA